MIKKAVFLATVLYLLPSVALPDFLTLPANPLSLEEALSFSNHSHLELDAARLELELAVEKESELHFRKRTSLEAEIVPRSANRAQSGIGRISDGHLALQMEYLIHDFGRHQAELKQAKSVTDMASFSADYERLRREIEIMSHYFAVLLADLDYAVKNEKMTLAFLRFNRLQEEMELHNAHAEVDVLEAETIYREEFHIREAANLNRQSNRRELGLVLGFSDYIPRDLIEPDVSKFINREVPEYNELLEQVFAGNDLLAIEKLKLQQAIDMKDVTKAKYQPQLKAILRVTEWEQKTGSRNSASVALQFKIPFGTGVSKSKDLWIDGIAIELAKTNLNIFEHKLRKHIFQLWKQLRLQHIAYATAKVRTEYRDQYMDRSRALYELEERSDLGDAQAELLRALHEMRKIEYAIAITWAEIDVLRKVFLALN